MSGKTGEALPRTLDGPTRRSELFAFLLLSVLIWPVIAVGVVGTWGLLVWMHHAFIALPGPH